MRIVIVALALCAGSTYVVDAYAQSDLEEVDVVDEVAEEPGEERAAQFVGVRGADAERVPGGALLLSAYGIVWLLLFFYLMRLRGLQRQTSEEVARLASKVQGQSE